MTDALLAHGGLFASALFAATILPMQSEAVLVGLLLSGQYSPLELLATASCGNVLGAVCNWWLGLRLERFKNRSWFPVSRQQLERAQAWYRRYGRWSLLLCWAPVIGDPLTLAAGVLREPLPVFLLLAGGAKIIRYLALTALTLGWLA